MSGAPTEHGPGELDESTFLESREGQLRLWRMSMRARYVAVVSIAVLALLPVAGPHRFWIAAALALLIVPYNYIYDASMRRTHHLSPIVAFSDQVVVVAFLAYAPELVAPILLVMLSINATSAVSFGRKIAAEGAAVGWLGAAGVLWASGNPAHGWASFLVYALASAFIITVVGGIAAIERDVRGRYVDLMGGIDAVVWEQLTHAPTTLYVNRRATDIIGYPAESWTQPHFWHEHVHPDDREWVAQQYRQAVKAGRNTEIEYRFVRPDGTTVWLQDRMRVEVDSANHATSVRGVMVDVTARKLAEEQTAQYLNLVQHVDVALFVFALAEPADHLSLTLLAINPVGARLVSPSARPGSPIGRRLLDIAPDIDQASADLVCEALTEVIHKGEGFRFDEMRFDPDRPQLPDLHGQRLPAARRLSGSLAPGRDRAGHLGGRSAASGPPRRPDRPAQPLPPDRSAAPLAAPLVPDPGSGGAAGHGPGPVQGDQRRAGPRPRRPVAHRAEPTPPGPAGTHRRGGGPAGRRRVRCAADRPGRPGHGRAGRGGHPRGPGAALPPGRDQPAGQRQHRHRRLPRARGGRRDAGPPSRRGHVHGQAHRRRRGRLRARTRPVEHPSTLAAGRAASGHRRGRAGAALPAIGRSGHRRGPRPPRRWCAGCIPSTASCRPASSSSWPRCRGRSRP